MREIRTILDANYGSVAFEDVIGYLRDHATEDGKRVGMMGDDGEKFGAWPTTFEHCWGQGRWVERFFEALEANADWLSTVTPSRWLERELAPARPRRRRLRNRSQRPTPCSPAGWSAWWTKEIPLSMSS